MSKRRVLVVDDGMDTRIFISTLLETSGYKPIAAVDGMDGLNKAKEIRPELIILDVMMPREGGVEMYRRLKADETLRGIPVIMLSGIAKKTFFHSQNLLNLYENHIVPEPEAYIEKPPEPEELLQWTRNLLGG